VTASYGGGAEKLILDQAKFFNKDLFKLHIISFREGNIEDEFRELKDVKYFCLNAPKKFKIKTLKRLLNYIKKNNMDLIHAHLIEPELYLIPIKIFKPFVKIIITKHGADEFRKNFPLSTILKLLSLLCNKIICVSDSRRKFAEKYETINPEKISVIYNGVDTEKFKKIDDKIQRNLLREDLKIGKDDFIIASIGRLVAVKGYNFLIKASEILKPKIKNLKILIIGEGELENKIKKSVNEKELADYFIFSKFRSDLDKIYSIIDIFCLPSIREGLSTVLLECMSCENLAVISALESNKEIADENEAVYYKTGDHHELAEKLLFFYEFPEKMSEIKLNARKKILSKFNYVNNLRKIEKLYLETINLKLGNNKNNVN